MDDALRGIADHPVHGVDWTRKETQEMTAKVHVLGRGGKFATPKELYGIDNSENGAQRFSVVPEKTSAQRRALLLAKVRFGR